MTQKNISDKLELVIFDIDGTLYDQSKLRILLFRRLLCNYIIKPWRYYDLVILYYFRKERAQKEGYSSLNLENEQYEWCAQKVNRTIQEVKEVVNKWIFDIPNAYLLCCMYPGVAQYIIDLKNHGIKTAVYSDYPSEQKLKYMNIKVDIQVSSTDKSVNSFKPLPKGIFVILKELGIENKNNCLFIGDRFELDGLCADNAGLPFLIINKKIAEKGFYLKRSVELINSRN